MRSSTVVLKVGAHVVLRRNINIEINGTLAVVIFFHPSCIVAKLANLAHEYPVPRFRQWIEIRGVSYSVIHQQFPVQLTYCMQVQGCTVQKAVVCLGDNFFCFWSSLCCSKQSELLSDLVLWGFDPSAIHLEPFYQQLLQWCDNVDVIRPTPPTDVVEHPEISHDLV